jgi:leader peptidase (prepilin peptidase) / N-methyltransferase
VPVSMLIVTALIVGLSLGLGIIVLWAKRQNAPLSRWFRGSVLLLMMLLSTSSAVIATDGLAFALLLMTAGLLVYTSIIDLHVQRLPTAINAALLVLGLVYHWHGGGSALYLLGIWVPVSVLSGLVAAGLCYAAFVAIDLVYRQVRGRTGLGAGDAKLVAALGAWVGLDHVPWLIVLASISALCFWGVGPVTAGMPRADKSESGRVERIPFGPHLAAAAWILICLR